MPSKIAWCDITWNPIVGCSHVSPGCDHCYAERMAVRLAGMGMELGQYDWVTRGPSQAMGPSAWNGRVTIVEDMLKRPLRWRKPRRIFICSMGDLFHGNVRHGWTGAVWDIIMQTPRHTYMTLTKRPGNIAEHMATINCLTPPFLPNLWLGVTAEDQQRAQERIPELLKCPAAVRFVSVEPMLGPVDLSPWLDELDWVIVGGETGPGARQMKQSWAMDIRDQCRRAGVPFFFKQHSQVRPGKKLSKVLDGKHYHEFPEVKT